MRRPLILTLIALLVLATVLPLLWVGVLSLSQATYLGATSQLGLDNFARFLGDRDFAGELLFPRQLVNSLAIAVATAALGVVTSVTTAFAFSRLEFPLRKLGLSAMMLTQMFPAVVTAIPLLFLLDAVNLFGTRVGLVIVYASSSVPFSVWMLKGHFDAIPRELELAARLDGASSWFILRYVMLPLVAPGVGLTFLFSFMNAYNEFVLAALFLDNVRDYTLPVTLNDYVGGFDPNWGVFAAGSLILSLPIVALFYYVQKRTVMGALGGAVKG